MVRTREKIVEREKIRAVTEMKMEFNIAGCFISKLQHPKLHLITH